MRFPLPIHSYRLRSTPASTARNLNCYVEALPPDAKGPVLLTRTPGVASWSTIGGGPIAGMHAAFGYLFVVSGTSLYKVDSNKVATLLGSVGTPGKIDIEHNDIGVVVVNPPNAYFYNNATATFGQITDADFRGSTDVEFIDNFLLFIDPGTAVFYCADLGSLNSFDALNFATAEGAPDDLIGVKVDHRQIVLFGEETTELWENVGGAGFPFQRAINGFIELGCLNGRTVAKQDNSVFWVANDYTVRRLDGATPIRISQHAVEQAIASSTAAELKAYTYSQDGHLFYVLIASEFTWVYDATTKEWHERGSYGFSYWRAGSHAQAFGLELVGDSTSNAIGVLDPETYTEFGGTQRVEWAYQPIYAEQRRAFHDRLEVVLESGVGLTTGQGSDPEMMLDYSNDGGKTWNSLPNKKIGQIGNFETRVAWSALGSARQRVYRAAVSDPIPLTITDTQTEVRGGRV